MEKKMYFCILINEGVIGGAGREQCQQITGFPKLGIVRNR
jgi:hypothetical protein